MKAVVALLVPVSIVLAGCGGQEPQEPNAPAAGPASARRIVRPDRFPADRPYSFGVWAGDTLYLSGQTDRDPVSGTTPDGIAAQTRQAMNNIGEVLKAAGLDHSNLVKCHVYLRSMDDYTGMNQVYGSFFSGRVPARTTVEVAGLPHDSNLEISCIGFRDRTRISVVTPPAGSLPAPLGPYSAAVWAGDTLYLSGMGGQFPKDRRLPEGLPDQVAQTLVNIRTTLDAADLRLADVVSSNVYLTVKGQAGDLEGAYAAAFQESSEPPRGLIFLPRLPGGIKTEITFVAARGGERQIIGVADRNGRGSRGSHVGRTLYTRAEAAPEAGAGFDEQFREVLRRLLKTVEDAGMRGSDVVSIQVYLSELSDLDSMNRISGEVFAGALPARTTVLVQSSEGRRVSAALVAAPGS